MRGDPEAREAARIRDEYRRRDAAAGPPPVALDPARQAYLQDLEWQLLRALRDAEVPLAGASVLDVGAGTGDLLTRMLDLGAATGTGIELTEARVAQGRRRHPGLDLRQADASRMPFDDATFDLVTQFTCLSSVLDPGVRGRIAAEMRRVVRPGGAVVSYDLRPAPLPLRAAGTALRRRRERAGQAPLWTPVEPLDVAELRRLFGDDLHVRSVTLNVALPGALRRGRIRAMALGLLPGLRSHLLAVARASA